MTLPRGRDALGRRLRVFRWPVSDGVRWAILLAAPIAIVHGTVRWFRSDEGLEAELLNIAVGFSWGVAVMFAVWLLIRRLSTVAVHEAGVVVGNGFGFRVAIRWDEIDRTEYVSPEGFALVEVHRTKKANGFIPRDIYDDVEFQRSVMAASGGCVSALFPGTGSA